MDFDCFLYGWRREVNGGRNDRKISHASSWYRQAAHRQFQLFAIRDEGSVSPGSINWFQFLAAHYHSRSYLHLAPGVYDDPKSYCVRPRGGIPCPRDKRANLKEQRTETGFLSVKYPVLHIVWRHLAQEQHGEQRQSLPLSAGRFGSLLYSRWPGLGKRTAKPASFEPRQRKSGANPAFSPQNTLGQAPAKTWSGELSIPLRPAHRHGFRTSWQLQVV